MTASDAFYWDVPERFNLVRDVIEPLAADPGRRAATIIDPTGVLRQLTFADVAREASRWAHVLRADGRTVGDRVIVVADAQPDWIAATLGCVKAGLVAVPCPASVGSEELSRRVREVGASLVVAGRGVERELDRVRAAVDRPVGVLYLDDARLLLQRYPGDAPTEETLWCDEAFILYTAGVTGTPKAVVHSHAAVFAARVPAADWLDVRAGDLVWCDATPGTPSAVWNILVGPWSCGAEIALPHPVFDAAERLDLIDRLGVTVVCQSATTYRAMSNTDTFGALPLASLRHVACGGAPVSPETTTRFREVVGLTIYEAYTQTESQVPVASTPGSEVAPGSPGYPLRGHEVAVVDEHGQPVDAGVIGKLAVRARVPPLFMRYWNDVEMTAAAYRGGWYVTGDDAAQDDDGRVWLTPIDESSTRESLPIRDERVVVGSHAPQRLTPAEEQRREREAVRAAAVEELANGERERRLAAELAAAAEADAIAQELERRRLEDAARGALEQAERRRRAERRTDEERRARDRRRNTWTDGEAEPDKLRDLRESPPPAVTQARPGSLAERLGRYTARTRPEEGGPPRR